MRRQNHGLAGELDDRHQLPQGIDVHFVNVRFPKNWPKYGNSSEPSLMG
jgi:hypothetical protein